MQDLGRPGYAHLGVSASGAADALSLRAGNLLVGNADNAAALGDDPGGRHVRVRVCRSGGAYGSRFPMLAFHCGEALQ